LLVVKHVPCTSVVGPVHVYVGDALVTRKNAVVASPPQDPSVGAALGAGVGETLGAAVGAVGAAVGEREACMRTASAVACAMVVVVVVVASGDGE
jgi:hypothetical protein